MENIETKEVSVFQRSYISSFADYSQSKSTKEKFQKASIFFFCVCCLTWQCSSLMNAYWSYSTVRKEVTSKPLKFIAPAITVCDSVTRNRSLMCQENPDKCYFVDKAALCQDYPLYCNDASSNYGIFKEDFMCKDDCPSWSDVYKKANASKFNAPGLNDENEVKARSGGYFKKIPFTTNKGEPTVCYTYGVIENQAEDFNISAWLTWFMFAKIKAYDYLNTKENATLYLVIHDARRKVNPFREGVKLQFDIRYRIFVNEEVEIKLLPFPYDTNCTDYLKEWKRNNGSGPLTTLDCIEYCQFSHYLKERNCIPRYLRMSHTIKLCNASEIIPQDLVKYCIDQCGVPCLERNYKYVIRKSEKNIPVFYEKNGESNLYDAGFQMPIRISFKSYHLTKIIYEPSIIMLDIYSNIGGYLGIWLGVSLLSFLDLLYLICVFFLNECQSMMKKLKIRVCKTD